MKLFIASSALLGVALAGPLTSSLCITYVDTYDDLAVNSAFPALSPLTTYNGLVYEHWDVKKVIPGPSNFAAKSPSNVAVAAALNDISSGTVTFTPFGTISAAPGTTSFDLKSFYLACNLALAGSLVGDAESCTVSVTGIYANGGQAPVQTFTFANTNPGSTKMTLAELPASYAGLTSVTLGIAGAGTNVATAGINIDSLTHCNHR